MKDGTIVTLEYEGRLEDGEIFDSSEKSGQSLTFEIGAKQVIPGFENAAKDMKEGEEKEFTLEPNEGYGEIRDELKQKVPKSALNLDKDPEKGMQILLHAPNGQKIPGTITSVTENDIEIDLNHPLAGKKLIFKIKVTKIEEKK